MSQIDWGKAPEGATHYGVATYSDSAPDWCEAFYKKVGFRWRICFPNSHDWHGDASRNPDWNDRFETLIERPGVWNGEGLPPAGSEVEIDHSCAGGGISKVTIIAHIRARMLDCAVYQKGDEVSYASRGAFKPIRTPEQIAAEERERGIVEMCELFMRNKADAIRVVDCCERLYDAGCRMPGKEAKV